MKNVHITLTHFSHESRVIKEINSLLKHGVASQVVVVAIWKPGLKKSERIANNIKVIRVNPYLVYVIKKLTGIGEISFIKLLNILLSCYVFFLKPNIVNIHHVNALGIVRLKSVLKGCHFIYDAHELETETQSSVGRLKVFRQKLEKRFMPLVDHTFVVTPSIENWYREKYQIERITTVMNTPLKHGNLINEDIFRRRFKIDKNDTIFIYNGSLFDGRGIRILLEVFEQIPNKSSHIVFMGEGELKGLILGFEKRTNNIHFHEAVEPSKVIEYTASADVGISLIENVCLSYYYCLPNKIFEYTMAEIPLIVSNMMDMSNYVLNNKVGIVAESNSVSDVTQCVEEMSRDKARFKNALLKAKDEYNWENEEKKMIQAYESLLG